MNILTNKVPFGLLSEEEKELFVSAKNHNCEWFNHKGEWTKCELGKNTFCKAHVYRLKLKEGEWYVLENDLGEYLIEFVQVHESKDIEASRFYVDGNNNGAGDFSINEIKSIRPATQEEIESVKPKFKRGDVVVSDEFYYGCSSKKGHILYRYKGGLGECLHKVESIILADGEFKFDTDCGTSDKRNKATPDQIKQLELEEMKHGKEWNGEGYDNWLTADGLTWNELLEHDLSEIEFEHNQGWSKTLNEKEAMNVSYIKEYRLKPKETKEQIRIKELEEELEECYDRINGMAEFFAEQEKRAQDFCYKVVKVGGE